MDREQQIGDLEDKLKHRDRRIAELQAEVDELRILNSKWLEYEEDYTQAMESWHDAFDMVLNDDGLWSLGPWIQERDDLIDRYIALRKKWNRFVPQYNRAVAPRPIGRPLAASDAQCATVRKMLAQGMSLRQISDETNLSLSTVRTIRGQMTGTDRTTMKHRKRLGLERVAIDKEEQAKWKRQRRQSDALPKRVQEVIERGHELAKETKR